MVDGWSSSLEEGLFTNFLTVCPIEYTGFVVSEKIGIP